MYVSVRCAAVGPGHHAHHTSMLIFSYSCYYTMHQYTVKIISILSLLAAVVVSQINFFLPPLPFLPLAPSCSLLSVQLELPACFYWHDMV